MFVSIITFQNLLEQVTLQGTQISNVLEKQQLNYDEDDDDSDHDQDHGPPPGSSLQQLEMKQEGDQGDGWSR